MTSIKRYAQKMYGCGTAGKKYSTSASQAFYTRTRSSYSKARSSHQRCSIKKDVLRKFVKFTGKHLWYSLSLIRPATLLKKRLRRRCFLVNFTKFLRTTFLQNTSGRLLLYISCGVSLMYVQFTFCVQGM